MKPWRRNWLRYRRQNRFLLGLYLGLMGLGGLGFVLVAWMRRLPPEELTNRLLVFLLWWFDLTLITILIFVLLRNLVRLLLERHRGILGSRFRTKLVLSYLVLILVPAILLFTLGVLLLSQTTATWLAAPVGGMARAGAELAEGLRADTEARVSRSAAVLMREVSRDGDEPSRVRTIERLHALTGSHLTKWVRDGMPVVELLDPRQRLLQRLPLLDSRRLPPSGVRSERFGGTIVVQAWERLPDGSLLVVAEALPASLVTPQGRLAAAAAAYERLKLERPALTATIVLGFGGLSLVVVSAAMWLGLYLSRRFTEPLLALVATTDRVAAGDSLEEVPIPAEDEVGLLVGSFNAMARRLRDREEELRGAIRRLDAVLGAVRTGVLELDADRKEVRGNPAAAALLGQPRLAVDALQLDELAAAGLPRLVEVIRSATGPVRGSLTVNPATFTRTLEVAVVPLGPGDAPHGWVVALEDLTPLLRAQRQAAWSEAARRIAHQIKNPLTPIRLAAERMARHAQAGAGDIAEVVATGCRAVVEHVQAMQEMVDAFARYAKLPAVSRRPVDATDLVAQVTTLYREVKPGVTLRFERPQVPCAALLDPDLFRQVLTNLLDNAFEASRQGEEIVVSLAVEDTDLVVQVTDSGPGIKVEEAELLFQPFYSTKGRGSGVGLAVVQRIVGDHGGTVRLEPNRDRGVRAVVRIPMS